MLDVDLDFEKHLVTVVFDGGKTDSDALKRALEKAGFPVEGEAKVLK